MSQEMTLMRIASAYVQNGFWEIRELRAFEMPRAKRNRTVARQGFVWAHPEMEVTPV